jgi:hypothetical protein
MAHCSLAFIVMTMSGCVLAATYFADIEPMPVVAHSTRLLDVALTRLRGRITSNASECMNNAKGMGVRGMYEAKLGKTIETSRIVVIEVLGNMSCDGVHSSSYQYAIAFDTKTGTRIDLNRIYAIGIRRDVSISLRPELLDVVKKSYKRANSSNPACLERDGWEDSLRAYSFTMSPLPDGRIILYYSRPDIEATCLPPMKLGASDVKPYRDAQLAAEYGLP